MASNSLHALTALGNGNTHVQSWQDTVSSIIWPSDVRMNRCIIVVLIQSGIFPRSWGCTQCVMARGGKADASDSVLACILTFLQAT